MKQLSMWIALTSVIAASLACAIPFGIRTIRGSGNVVTEEREVSGFDSVALSAFGEVIISQGDDESLTIETDDNLMPYIQTEVRNGTLELGWARNIVPVPSRSLVFRVSVKELVALNSSGAGRFEIDELDTDRLNVNLSGAGDIKINSLTATDLAITVSGAGNVEVAGAVETQEISLSGLGNYVAPDLESQAATVRISGAGDTSIWVQDSLDVVISGAGNVDYFGSPQVTKEISGVGGVTSRGDK
ncbi:MAG: DUF2807 domain-containing protein [Anaerolineales bacterium]|nr:MAG: DUF2807 domain-containing protein [Anaerolineales bacterium]